MHKGYLQLAAFLGALSVALGAFAAHGLKKVASEYAVGIFETGVRYQFYHVFALALTAILWKDFPVKTLNMAGIFFILGIICFSGSLYLLTWMNIKDISATKFVGPITPLGGLFFIVGWVLLLVSIKKS
ncbi:MAG: DUF423 domain-containing protein [Filimonas sp.]|nr:DUF423 domain-containing protein [Filimonas sp.]